MTIPKDVLTAINNAAKQDWPDDIEMQEHVIESEVDSYKKVQMLDFSGAENIKETLIEESFEINSLWEECLYVVETELEAYRFVKGFSDSEIPEKFANEIIKKAIADNPDWYDGQKDSIERQVSKYKQRKKLNEEVGPLKDLLIELESIIGNECSNEYSHWGNWYSSGSSFRYPLTIIKDNDNPSVYDDYKVRTVSSSTPIEELITGHYKFGANHLDIYKALVKVVNHLQDNYGFEIPDSKKFKGSEE